jgi:hypothetical protein
MFLTTTVWVLLLPTPTLPKLRLEGVNEICCAPARAEKNATHKDKKKGKPHFEQKLVTAHTFACAQRAAQRGDWCGVLSETTFENAGIEF